MIEYGAVVSVIVSLGVFTLPIFALWRIANRTGHGHWWNAACLCAFFTAIVSAVTLVFFDLVTPYCNGTYEFPPCWAVSASQPMPTVYLILVLIILLALSLKRWPIERERVN